MVYGLHEVLHRHGTLWPSAGTPLPSTCDASPALLGPLSHRGIPEPLESFLESPGNPGSWMPCIAASAGPRLHPAVFFFCDLESVASSHYIHFRPHGPLFLIVATVEVLKNEQKPQLHSTF